MATLPNNPAPAVTTQSSPRDWLARIIAVVSAAGVIFIAAVAIFLIFFSEDDPNNPRWRLEVVQYIFGALLPLIGTWMGTILAYYFSKENFQAANQSVQNLVSQITSTQKLESIKTRDVMIPIEQIRYYELRTDRDSATVLLEDLLKFMYENKITRLPILNERKEVRFMIHRSIFESFIAQQAMAGAKINPPSPLGDLSLHDLETGAPTDIQKVLNYAWGFVSLDSNLRDAQLIIERVDVCQDVFVTQTGKNTEPVLGWITNATIAENAKV